MRTTLAIVLVVALACSVLLFPPMETPEDPGGRDRTIMTVRAYTTAVNMFALDHGRIPTQEEGLEVLVDDSNPSPKTKQTYLDHLRRDIWGTPFVYKVADPSTQQFAIYSTGSNRVDELGLGDDIGIPREYRCEDFNTCRKPTDYLFLATTLITIVSSVWLAGLMCLSMFRWIALHRAQR